MSRKTSTPAVRLARFDRSARRGALAAFDVDVVFVLGHIDYYPRAGFRPALPLGLRAPYPIEPAMADAWMVRERRPGLLGAVRGKVQCANAPMHRALWQE